MPAGKFDFKTILRVLDKHQVKSIVVGGVCATIHGAQVSTFDLDLVYSRDAENLVRLETALQELDTYYREHPPHRIIPQAERLDTPGHHLLMTSAGPLDLLGSVTGKRGYEDLLPHAIELRIDEECSIKLLSLPMLITLKTETGREKDKLVLPALRSALAEQESAQNIQEDDTAP